MFEDELKNSRIAVIGLGNIGLPLAIELGKKYSTIGFDIDKKRIESLNQGIDIRKNDSSPLILSKNLSFTEDFEDLISCNIYIISVPTSVNPNGTPNISFLIDASKNIASLLKKHDLVIFESTVFPGCTENICVPILEKYSFLIYNKDFFVGYSPERINTADNVHTLINTVKVTSGSDEQTAKKVDYLYTSIITAGTHLVSSIRVAEASKLLENAQRDVNIAFMNNVATILSSQNLPFDEVWNASRTKWNFIDFLPGLVGGDCLPVASQYLNYVAKDNKGSILNISRKINDELPQAIADLIINRLKKTFPNVLKPQLLILGISYKSNTSSIKGSLVPRLVKVFNKRKLHVEIYDPIAENFKMPVEKVINYKKYHVIIKAVNHPVFLSLDYSKIAVTNCLIFDINKWSFKEPIL